MCKLIKKISKIGALGLVLLTMASCATTKGTASTADNLSSVYVTNTNKIHVLKPEYMEDEIDCLYVFSADFGNQSLSALSYFFSNKDGMEMLLLNDFGMEMGNLQFDGDSVDFTLPVKTPIKGEYIVCDLENIFYPEYCLKENYNANGLTFESSEENGVTVRTISKKDKTIERIEIKKTQEGIPYEVSLDNSLRGYSYHLVLAEE